MPRDIESYVHRIGRTARCGKTGQSTTFINRLSFIYFNINLNKLKSLKNKYNIDYSFKFMYLILNKIYLIFYYN